MTMKRVAVLGAGVMGSGIAAHLANAGIPSILFDIVPKDAGDDPKARNAYALKGIETARKIKPAALLRADDAALITAANYDDHGDLLATCDWIVEVVVERLDIKQKVFAWVAANRAPGSIVSSNTSGIPLADMAAAMPADMRSRFLITHFFNPVRYMRLLEIVSGPDTDPAVVQQVAEFGEKVLGKGIVFGKDTPNFIANRIGTFGMASVFRHMLDMELSIEAVDAIFGAPMGRPKSAVFNTADVVGIDTLVHVMNTVVDKAEGDERRAWFAPPKFVTDLVAAGATGRKTGAGFYKKVGRDILVLDLATGEYRAQDKPRFPSIGKARGEEKLDKALQAMVYGDDPAAEIAWRVTADTLIYAANRIPEIADDVVNVDRGMRWGFGWTQGPFETWDAIGVRRSVEKMQGEGREVPAWVLDMLAKGRERFYARDAAGDLSYFTRDGEIARVPTSPRHLQIVDLKAKGAEVARNPSASLLDLGDGVLGLEFHSKMNSLDELIFDLYEQALDKLDTDAWQALVVSNQDDRAFCAGANVLMVLMASMQGKWDDIEKSMARLQGLMMRARYNAKPVVTGIHGLTLGGGAEVGMHSAHMLAAAESYVGLVEVGVGLIPGAGGCKELVMRYLGEAPQSVSYDPNPAVQKVFEVVGLAKVATGAEEARDMGFLRHTDTVVLDGASLLFRAKQAALGLAQAGYTPPRQRTAKLPGRSGLAAIEAYLQQMHDGGFATAHDMVVGKALGKVITGGDIPSGTVRTEQDLLDLERESFLYLCGTAATQARIQHMLQKGKPLRN